MCAQWEVLLPDSERQAAARRVAREIIGTCGMQQPGCDPPNGNPDYWCLKCRWIPRITDALLAEYERGLTDGVAQRHA